MCDTLGGIFDIPPFFFSGTLTTSSWIDILGRPYLFGITIIGMDAGRGWHWVLGVGGHFSHGKGMIPAGTRI